MTVLASVDEGDWRGARRHCETSRKSWQSAETRVGFV